MPRRLPPELQFLQQGGRLFDVWQLCHTSKLFPIDTSVVVNGRLGIYRVVSDPYILRQHDCPYIDVEACGKRFCVKVFEASGISN